MHGSLFCLPQSVGRNSASAREFGDALSMMCYKEAPPNFPARCSDGCDTSFILQHALASKKGGLVIFCHNEIRDELVNLVAGKAFTRSTVRDEPLIKPSHVTESEKEPPTKDTSQNKTE